MRSKNGQIALIALLVLAVATTVGLALISRSSTSVATSRNAEESSRAFSAAEAGLEQALSTGAVGTSQVLESLSNSFYQTSIATVSAGANVPFVFPKKTAKGETETLWLVKHNADNSLVLTPTYTANSIDVCWGTNTPLPALVATVLYKESSDNSYRAVKAAYDPDAARAAVDNFAAPSAGTGGCGDGATTYKQTLTFNGMSAAIDPAVDTLIMLRLRPVFNDAQIAVVPAAPLPDQLSRIESVGQTQSGTTRKITVFKQFNSPSSIFDAAVYSQGSFVQQ